MSTILMSSIRISSFIGLIIAAEAYHGRFVGETTPRILQNNDDKFLVGRGVWPCNYKKKKEAK